MSRPRSAWPAWAALVALVVTWDVAATRIGFESMTACWRRLGRDRRELRCLLAAAVSWLDHHLQP